MGSIIHKVPINLVPLPFSMYGNYIFIMCFSYITPYISAAVVMSQFLSILNLAQKRLDIINQ